MTYPITPKPSIHQLSPAQKQKQNLAQSQQVEAMAKQMVGAIINSILQILTGGAIGGSGTTNGLDLFGNLFSNLFKTLGITDPSGTLATIEKDLYNVEDVLTHWVDNIMAPLNLVLDGKTWQGFIDEVVGGFNGSVNDLTATLKTTIAQAEESIGKLVGLVESSAEGTFTGLLTQIETMLTNTSSLSGGTLVGTVPTDVLHVLDLGSVDQTLQELTGNGSFLSSHAIDPAAAAAGITWDASTARTTGGSAKFVANSTTKSLFSNPITVSQGQQISLSTYVKWASLGITTGTSTPIELNVATFKDGVLTGGTGNTGFTNIGVAGGVGTSSDWTHISGTFTVPAGVDRVMMKITLRNNAVGGNVWFDEASMTRTGVLAGSWMSGSQGTVAADFQHIVDAIHQAVNGGSSSDNSIYSILPNIQQVFGAIYNAVYPTSATTATAANAQAALQAAWYNLFGYSYVKPTLWGTALPLIDGTKLDPNGSNIPTGVIPDITRDMSQDMQDTIDAIYSTIAGTGSDLTPAQAKQKFQSLMNLLFGQFSAYGKTALWPNAVPTLDGTKIDGSPGAGKVPVNAVPTTDVGKAILPGGGSGGMLIRTDTTPYSCSTGRNMVSSGFWSSAQITPTSDLYISGNSFQITTSGWYAVEISYALNFVPAWGWQIAPVLFKNGGAFKVGGDAMGVSWGFGSGAQRYAQSTFVVYLGAGESVQAGYDMALGGFDPHLIKADSTGAETYFGCSLISKSYV